MQLPLYYTVRANVQPKSSIPIGAKVEISHILKDLGVATFGSQDLGFRTSIFGSQDLGFRTSINGHCSLLLLLPPCFYNASVAAFGSQDLGFRTSLTEAGSAIENPETGSAAERPVRRT
jgi:hypothetical protein